MSIRVIGAGFGRTGTTSLRTALERLGFDPCYHMDEVNRHPEHITSWERALTGDHAALEEVLEGYAAGVDWPVCAFWAELVPRHPDAVVILTTRAPDDWYESMRRTVVPLTRAGLDSADPDIRRQVRFGNELVFERTFGGRFDDRRHALGVLQRHEEEVRARVDHDRLLVYELRDGWGPLCDFLGVDEPGEPFPHRNSAREFWQTDQS